MKYLAIILVLSLLACKSRKIASERKSVSAKPPAERKNLNNTHLARERIGSSYLMIDLRDRRQTLHALLSKSPSIGYTHIYLVKNKCDSVFKLLREPLKVNPGYRDQFLVNTRDISSSLTPDDHIVLRRLRRVVDSLGWCHKNVLYNIKGFVRKGSVRR